jgi:hypothetical protein
MLAALGLWAVGSAMAGPIVFDPLHAGSFATGTGADAAFYQIDPSWHGSTVLWNEATHTYGNGDAIGSFGWGSGIWGRADWEQVQAAAAGSAGAGAPAIVDQWVGRSNAINYGNACYNSSYSSTWGVAEALPFDGGACGDTAGNWTSHFSGFVRITEEGLYNFSVLYDDGFFLRLIGAGGESLEIDQDFLNPRNREGFVDDLQLSVGLYGFELGSWNREQAGVVDLRWSRGDENWTPVPIENLLPGGAIPEPPLVLLLGAGLGAAAWASRRRRAATKRT